MEEIKLINDMGKNHSRRPLEISPIHRRVSCVLACWEFFFDIVDNNVEHFILLTKSNILILLTTTLGLGQPTLLCNKQKIQNKIHRATFPIFDI